MQGQKASVKKPAHKKRHMDFAILVLTIILLCVGLIMVYDASYYAAQQSADYEYDGAYFFKKQLLGAAMGVVLLIVGYMVPYQWWRKWCGPLLIVGLISLCLVWVPKIGVDINGARRWIKIPGLPSIQPSEIARFAMVVYLAHGMTIKHERMGSFKQGVLPFIAVMCIYCGLIALQPNLSMLASFVLLTLVMLWIGGANLWHLGGVTLAGGAGVGGLMFLMPHAFQRYLAFIDPWKDAQGNGYQLVQSLYAVGAGGWTGLGFGNSRQKFLYLPYRESDFIFAIYIEEFGFLGAIALLAVYWLLIWRGIRVATRCPDRFGRYLAAGIVGMIAIQVIINVAVVTGSMPPTGLPLPFISAGGSSLAIFMAEIGILLNISKQSAAA
nr:putative lipid II flippase FtsW [Maliibacterium massiliense]